MAVSVDELVTLLGSKEIEIYSLKRDLGKLAMELAQLEKAQAPASNIIPFPEKSPDGQP